MGVLKIEHLPILRGYGPRRRGEDNERDAATRSLRGGCAADMPHDSANGSEASEFVGTHPTKRCKTAV